MDSTAIVQPAVGMTLDLPAHPVVDPVAEKPADGRVVVMGAGVDHAVRRREIVWQKAVVGVAVEGELEDLHAGKS